jgi:hypothetical protein
MGTSTTNGRFSFAMFDYRRFYHPCTAVTNSAPGYTCKVACRDGGRWGEMGVDHARICPKFI